MLLAEIQCVDIFFCQLHYHASYIKEIKFCFIVHVLTTFFVAKHI